MQRKFDPVALAWIVCVPVVCLMLGFMCWQYQQGYNTWAAQMTAQNGTVVCEDSDVQIVRFGK